MSQAEISPGVPANFLCYIYINFHCIFDEVSEHFAKKVTCVDIHIVAVSAEEKL